MNSSRSHATLLLGVLGVLGVAACKGPSGGGDAKDDEGATGKVKSAQTTTRTTAAAAREGSSAEICAARELDACAGQNLTSDRCLTLYQACGRNLEIIEHFRSEAWVNDLRKWYYLGVAYHGMYLKNRSQAARCEFGEAAKLALQTYVLESAGTGGYNDQRVFQQTYHATKLLESVGDIEGCEANAVTRTELYNRTLAHGKELAENLFLGDPPQGPLGAVVRETKANIQASVQGFISKAANVETQLGLRKTAMDQSDTRLESAARIFTGSFGATVTRGEVQGKPSITAVTLAAQSPFRVEHRAYLGPLGATRETSGLKPYADDFLRRLREAMGGSSISDYEAARAALVGHARDALVGTAASMNRTQQASNTTLVADIKTKTAAAARGSEDGSRLFEEIRAEYRAYANAIGACRRATPPWYCK